MSSPLRALERCRFFAWLAVRIGARQWIGLRGVGFLIPISAPYVIRRGKPSPIFSWGVSLRGRFGRACGRLGDTRSGLRARTLLCGNGGVLFPFCGRPGGTSGWGSYLSFGPFGTIGMMWSSMERRRPCSLSCFVSRRSLAGGRMQNSLG